MLKINNYLASFPSKGSGHDEKAGQPVKRNVTSPKAMLQPKDNIHKRITSEISNVTPSYQARAFLNKKRKASVNDNSHLAASRSPTVSRLKNTSYVSNRTQESIESEAATIQRIINPNRHMRERHQALHELSNISNGSRIAKRSIILQDESTLLQDRQKTDHNSGSSYIPSNIKTRQKSKGLETSSTANRRAFGRNTSLLNCSALEEELKNPTKSKPKLTINTAYTAAYSKFISNNKNLHANRQQQPSKSPERDLKENFINSMEKQRSPHGGLKQQIHDRIQNAFLAHNRSPNSMITGLPNKSQSQAQASFVSSPPGSQNQSLSILSSMPKLSKDGNNTSTTSTFEMIYRKIDSTYRAKEAQMGAAATTTAAQTTTTTTKEVPQKAKVTEEPVKAKHQNMQSRDRIQSVPEVSLAAQKNSQEKLAKPYLNGITEEPLEQKSPKYSSVGEPSTGNGNNDVSRSVQLEPNWHKPQVTRNINLQTKKAATEPTTVKTEPNKTETIPTEESKGGGLENKFKEHFKKQILAQPKTRNKTQTDFRQSISIQSKLLHLNDPHITKSPSFTYKSLSIAGVRNLENMHTPQQSKNSLRSAKNNSQLNLEISPEIKNSFIVPIPNSDSKPGHKKNSKSLASSAKPSARSHRKATEDSKSPQLKEKKSPVSSITQIKTEDTEPNQKPEVPQTSPKQQQKALPNKSISHTEQTEHDLEREAYVREKLREMNRHHFKFNNSCPDTVLDYYRLMKMIGKGAFGIVYLGIHLLTGRPVAIKAIDKKYMQDEPSKQKVLQEVAILKQANHRNIIQLLEVFENPTHLFLVLEYAAQGDLLNFVKNKGKLGEELAKKIFVQIVAGIKYCHQNQILHRDIKLDNILLDHNFVVKICDFGVSRFVEDGQVIKEQCGTPVYVAPEVISGKGYEGYDSDIWSLGVVLFAILTGSVPFKASTIEELQKVISGAQYSIPEFLTLECKDLIKRMLTPDPSIRIGIDQILSHRWFKKSQNAENKECVSNGDEKAEGNKGKVEKGSSIQIIDTVVRKVEALGYPREHIIQSVRQHNYNHILVCYLLFYKEYLDSMW